MRSRRGSSADLACYTRPGSNHIEVNVKKLWRALIVPFVLLALLALLSVMQYRWIGSTGEALRAHMQATAQSAARQMAEEFDGEISQLVFSFYQLPIGKPLDPDTFASRQYTAWLAKGRHTRLIRDVFIIDIKSSTEFSLRRVLPGKGTEPATPPAELASVLPHFKNKVTSSGRFLLADVPAFFTPLMSISLNQSNPSQVQFSGSSAGILFAWLDKAYLEKELLPGIIRKHFPAGSGFEYNVAVIAPREKNRIVYRSDARLTTDAITHADVKAGIMQVRFEVLMQAIGTPAGSMMPFVSDPNAGEWQLALVHRAGSLDKAIGIVRRRNLAIGFGVLLLLGVSFVFMIVSTKRAQRLARQQMVFVAGVSHELRTPLSVIRSAGENLSDGVIDEPAQVKRYGALIAQEGRRLSEMVEQVMAFAGFNTGRDLTDRAKTDVSTLVDQAVAASAPLVERNGFTVERHVEASLPSVNVNAAALSQAIANLISNAVKYSGPSRWVGVTAEAESTSRRPEVRVTVADRGIGIPAEEQAHIFEPFFRGRDVLASTIRGSGLGLSLVKRIVEAHGGTVTVRSSAGQGSAFTIHLPCERAGRAVASETAGEPV